jgi:hypothetical protein
LQPIDSRHLLESASFSLPATSASLGAVSQGTLFIGYGISSAGGVRAYRID